MGPRAQAAMYAVENPWKVFLLFLIGTCLVATIQYLIWRVGVAYVFCLIYEFFNDVILEFEVWPWKFFPICGVKCEREQCSNHGAGRVSEARVFADCNCHCDAGYSGPKCATAPDPEPEPPPPLAEEGQGGGVAAADDEASPVVEGYAQAVESDYQ